MIRVDPRQFDMFAALAPARAPAVLRQVDADGPVIQGEVDEALVLPHPRMAWTYARIELHQHTDGLWMWSTSYMTDAGTGSSYRVGAKWGQFAQSRDDALFYACQELRTRAPRDDSKARRLILSWIDELAAA